MDGGLAVVAIEVSKLVVESEVAVLDSVRVEHGDDVEDEEFPQHHTGLALGEEEVDESFDEVGGRGLGGVHSRRQQHHWTVL